MGTDVTPVIVTGDYAVDIQGEDKRKFELRFLRHAFRTSSTSLSWPAWLIFATVLLANTASVIGNRRGEPWEPVFFAFCATELVFVSCVCVLQCIARCSCGMKDTSRVLYQAIEDLILNGWYAIIVAVAVMSIHAIMVIDAVALCRPWQERLVPGTVWPFSTCAAPWNMPTLNSDPAVLRPSGIPFSNSVLMILMLLSLERVAHLSVVWYRMLLISSAFTLYTLVLVSYVPAIVRADNLVVLAEEAGDAEFARAAHAAAADGRSEVVFLSIAVVLFLGLSMRFGHLVHSRARRAFATIVALETELNRSDEERKKRELAVTERLAEEERARRSEMRRAILDGTIGYASHALRNPLFVIQSLAMDLSDKYEEDPVLSQALATIREEVRVMDKLTSDVLEHRQLLAGTVVIREAMVDLGSLLGDVVRSTWLASASVRAPDVRISVSSTSEAPDMLETDPLRLRQVLSNTMEFALQQAAPGTQVHVRVSCVQRESAEEAPGTVKAEEEESVRTASGINYNYKQHFESGGGGGGGGGGRGPTSNNSNSMHHGGRLQGEEVDEVEDEENYGVGFFHAANMTLSRADSAVEHNNSDESSPVTNTTNTYCRLEMIFSSDRPMNDVTTSFTAFHIGHVNFASADAGLGLSIALLLTRLLRGRIGVLDNGPSATDRDLIETILFVEVPLRREQVQPPLPPTTTLTSAASAPNHPPRAPPRKHSSSNLNPHPQKDRQLSVTSSTPSALPPPPFSPSGAGVSDGAFLTTTPPPNQSSSFPGAARISAPSSQHPLVPSNNGTASVVSGGVGSSQLEMESARTPKTNLSGGGGAYGVSGGGAYGASGAPGASGASNPPPPQTNTRRSLRPARSNGSIVSTTSSAKRHSLQDRRSVPSLPLRPAPASSKSLRDLSTLPSFPAAPNGIETSSSDHSDTESSSDSSSESSVVEHSNLDKDSDPLDVHDNVDRVLDSLPRPTHKKHHHPPPSSSSKKPPMHPTRSMPPLPIASVITGTATATATATATTLRQGDDVTQSNQTTADFKRHSVLSTTATSLPAHMRPSPQANPPRATSSAATPGKPKPSLISDSAEKLLLNPEISIDKHPLRVAMLDSPAGPSRESSSRLSDSVSPAAGSSPSGLRRVRSRATPKAALKPLGLHILVVDDEAAVRKVVTEWLVEKFGCRASIAKDGHEAIDTLTRAAPGTYDAVLMDIMMPGIRGDEATKRIAETHPHLPVLALTANPNSIKDQSIFHAILGKPFPREKLYQTLSKLP